MKKRILILLGILIIVGGDCLRIMIQFRKSLYRIRVLHRKLLVGNNRAIAAATITASCKNVDRVVALLDYMYSEEGTRLLQFIRKYTGSSRFLMKPVIFQ